MQTQWLGLAYPAANMMLEEVYFESSVPLTLADTPSVVTGVHMPDTSKGVHLRTFDASIWYAVDRLPGPIPPPLVGELDIGAEAFTPGGILFPNEQKALAFPDTGGLHILYLVSQEPSPLVYVTALTEMP